MFFLNGLPSEEEGQGKETYDKAISWFNFEYSTWETQSLLQIKDSQACRVLFSKHVCWT